MPLTELNASLETLYGPCDCHALPDMADIPKEQLRAIEDMIRQVWKDKGMPVELIDEAVTRLYAEKLWEAVTEGYGGDFAAFDWDTPDFKMLENLQKNVWNFSAAKNYQQLRELSNALIGADGKLNTEKQFFDAAFKINDRHVKQYLRVEREFAISSSQMASKWTEIQADKIDLPLLEFDAVLDTQTTALCRSLEGTLLPVDHSFWTIYYPPNHFGCRSTVRKKNTGKITSEIPTADIPAMFQNNLAKSGLVFPDGHAYWQQLPGEVIKKSNDLIPPQKK